MESSSTHTSIIPVKLKCEPRNRLVSVYKFKSEVTSAEYQQKN